VSLLHRPFLGDVCLLCSGLHPSPSFILCHVDRGDRTYADALGLRWAFAGSTNAGRMYNNQRCLSPLHLRVLSYCCSAGHRVPLCIGRRELKVHHCGRKLHALRLARKCHKYYSVYQHLFLLCCFRHEVGSRLEWKEEARAAAVRTNAGYFHHGLPDSGHSRYVSHLLYTVASWTNIPQPFSLSCNTSPIFQRWVQTSLRSLQFSYRFRPYGPPPLSIAIARDLPARKFVESCLVAILPDRLVHSWIAKPLMARSVPQKRQTPGLAIHHYQVLPTRDRITSIRISKPKAFQAPTSIALLALRAAGMNPRLTGGKGRMGTA